MKHVNFIPAELRPKLKIPGIVIPVGLFLVLACYVSGTMAFNFYASQKAQNELMKLSAENGEVLKKIEALSGSQKRLKLDEAIEGVKKLLAKKNYWSSLFKEMSVLIPDDVWLTGFTDTKEQASLKTNPPIKNDGGILVLKGEAASPELVAQFLTSLEKSRHFSGVQLKFSEREPDIRPSRYKFEFSIPIKSLTSEVGT